MIVAIALFVLGAVGLLIGNRLERISEELKRINDREEGKK